MDSELVKLGVRSLNVHFLKRDFESLNKITAYTSHNNNLALRYELEIDSHEEPDLEWFRS